VPSLPGCISYGKNLAEAKIMARDAIKGYIASLKKHREPVPTDDEIFISSISLQQPAAKLKLQYA
jgi:predicted RNase H-like HicB family nuclease